MSDLVNVQGKGVASTLADIEARLKEISAGSKDVSKLTVVKHSASGLCFRVGPMGRAKHEGWLNLRWAEDNQHRQSGGADSGAPLIRKASDLHLLQWACFTEDGERLTADIAKLLLDGDDFGPSTYALLEAAAFANPPREELVHQMAVMWGSSAANIVFWRVLKEAGLFKLLIERLAGNEKEKEAAANQIAKIEETLIYFEGAYQAEEAAKHMEIDVYKRLAEDLTED